MSQDLPCPPGTGGTEDATAVIDDYCVIIGDAQHVRRCCKLLLAGQHVRKVCSNKRGMACTLPRAGARRQSCLGRFLSNQWQAALNRPEKPGVGTEVGQLLLGQPLLIPVARQQQYCRKEENWYYTLRFTVKGPHLWTCQPPCPGRRTGPQGFVLP